MVNFLLHFFLITILKKQLLNVKVVQQKYSIKKNLIKGQNPDETERKVNIKTISGIILNVNGLNIPVKDMQWHMILTEM